MCHDQLSSKQAVQAFVSGSPESPWKAQGSLLMLVVQAEAGEMGRQSQILEQGRGSSPYSPLQPQSPQHRVCFIQWVFVISVLWAS